MNARAKLAATNRSTPRLDSAMVLAALPVPAVVVNAENRFTFANGAAEQFFKFSTGALCQMKLSDILPPDNRVFAVLAQIRRFDSPVSDYDLVLESPRINRRGVSVHGAPLHEIEGSVVLTLQDGSTAQMLEQNAPDADKELCLLIQDEVDRIRGLVDRFDMFSERPVELGPVNIHQVLDHVRRIAQTGFAAHLKFSEEYDPSLPPVWGNRDILVQIILNLVKNAAEAVDPMHGEIVLSTAYQHGVRIAVPTSTERVHLPLLVTVRDNGPGIPEEIQTTLFEPFVSTKRGGQGLGLALVAKLVTDLGGLIECESRPGRTQFRLSMPVPPAGWQESAL